MGLTRTSALKYPPNQLRLGVEELSAGQLRSGFPVRGTGKLITNYVYTTTYGEGVKVYSIKLNVLKLIRNPHPISKCKRK